MRRGYTATVNGRAVDLYTLHNANGLSARLTNHGARLVQMLVQDRHGHFADVVLGYDTLDALLAGHVSAGATIGRFAGRIRQARFKLDGKSVRLTANDGQHHLHGGSSGSRYKVFTAAQPSAASVRFTCTFEDGEDGYPGRCDLSVDYVLTDDNALVIACEATTDAPTLMNITHHSFWNLAGHDSGNIHGHHLTIHADQFAPVDDDVLPTGDVHSVAGTRMDFREPRPIGQHIAAGFSTHYLLRDANGLLRHAAEVHEPLSGRTVDVHTTEPGIVLFTGNAFDGQVPRDVGKGGIVYTRHAGMALETQHLPDAPNIAAFGSTVLRPGERYQSRTEYRFSTTGP
jgi:aldose 1-epimerase